MHMNEKISPKKKKIAAIILIVLILSYFIEHLFHSSKTLILPPPNVVVMQPQWKEMVEYVTQTGNLVAYNSVDLVARVEGYLDAVEFIDGSFVKKGQELFIIQPDPYLGTIESSASHCYRTKSRFCLR